MKMTHHVFYLFFVCYNVSFYFLYLLIVCYLLVLLILQITHVHFLFSLKDSIQIRTDEGKKVKLRAPGNNVMIRDF